MNRRDFIKNTCKTVAIASVAPAAIAAIPEKQVLVVTFSHGGKVYWFDIEKYRAAQDFYNKMEREMSAIWYERI